MWRLFQFLEILPDDHPILIERDKVNLFTDIFSKDIGELTEEQERVIDEILHELESSEAQDYGFIERCRHYISELEDDGTPPLGNIRLQIEEGEDVWCTTCGLRFFCKMKRKLVNKIKGIPLKAWKWILFLPIYGTFIYIMALILDTDMIGFFKHIMEEILSWHGTKL